MLAFAISFADPAKFHTPVRKRRRLLPMRPTKLLTDTASTIRIAAMYAANGT